MSRVSEDESGAICLNHIFKQNREQGSIYSGSADHAGNGSRALNYFEEQIKYEKPRKMETTIAIETLSTS